MRNKKYLSGVQEYASRCYCLYEYYNTFKRLHSTRKKKEYIRKIFNAWYKCPNWDGEYNEDYWQFVTEFNSDYTFRQFIYKYQKLLTYNQVTIFFKTLNEHIKLNT